MVVPPADPKIIIFRWTSTLKGYESFRDRLSEVSKLTLGNLLGCWQPQPWEYAMLIVWISCKTNTSWAKSPCEKPLSTMIKLFSKPWFTTIIQITISFTILLTILHHNQPPCSPLQACGDSPPILAWPESRRRPCGDSRRCHRFLGRNAARHRRLSSWSTAASHGYEWMISMARRKLVQ